MSAQNVTFEEVPPNTTSAAFREMIEQRSTSARIVVYFTASWCPISEDVLPNIRRTFFPLFLGPIVFFQVDVEQCEDICVLFNVGCIPLFHVYCRALGEVFHPIVGADIVEIQEQLGRIAEIDGANYPRNAPPPSARAAAPATSQTLPPQPVGDDDVLSDSDDDEDEEALLARALAVSLESGPVPESPPVVDSTTEAPTTTTTTDGTIATGVEADMDVDGPEAASAAPAPAPTEAVDVTAAPDGGKLTGQAAVDFMLAQNMITRSLHEEIVGMGFTPVQAALGLYAKQNASTQHAITWIEEHPNENTIEILAETDEMKAERIARESARLKAEAKRRRAQRVQEEKREAINREKTRRSGAKALRNARESYEQEQNRRLREERRRDERRQKQALAEARRKVKVDQITRQLERARARTNPDQAKIDELEARLAKLQGFRPPSGPGGADAIAQQQRSVARVADRAAAEAAAAAAASGPTCRIRVRLLDGRTEQKEFQPNETVKDVFDWVRTFQREPCRLQIPRGATLGAGDHGRSLRDAIGRGGSLICVQQ